MGTNRDKPRADRRRFLRNLAGGGALAALAGMRGGVARAQRQAGQVHWVYNPAGVRMDGAFVDDLLQSVMAEGKVTHPVLAGEFPHLKVERIASNDIFTTVNRLFYLRGWSDGLPIVPPTEERVKQMLRGTDLPPEEVVATLDPVRGQATVTKIAANAVMAGCRPEYMPVLIAATQIMGDPAFSLLGVSTTTGHDTPLILVNGPIAQALDINSGGNALGRGWQANAGIGRALHLIMNNIGGSWPQISDMSCLGLPGEFANCLAENEAANPWEPLHVELGHDKDASVVTVAPVEGTHGIMGIGWTHEAYLKLIASHLAALERPIKPVYLLFIAQDTAKEMARNGWTKESIRAFVAEHARLPFAAYKERFIAHNKTSGVPDWVLETTDPEAMIPVPFIDHLAILVAGGPGEKSMLMPVWSAYKKLLSKEVVLPRAWDKLLAEAEADAAAAG